LDVWGGDLQARFGEGLRFGQDRASQLTTKHSSAFAQQTKRAGGGSGNFNLLECRELANLFGRDDVFKPFNISWQHTIPIILGVFTNKWWKLFEIL